ncbi:Protein of uncharacterised function (DUF962) [Moraxella caviae]|nr:Protein of uncharacterised function (DUF962) [Moraxella caviae]VEW10544.1 Protein of uncharacterised function (DUF962) [Moraxella caviae]
MLRQLFRSAKPLDVWLKEYATSHKNATNKRIHYVCVPIIFLTIVALLTHISWWLAVGISVLALWFYVRLSVSLAVAMLVFIVLCFGAALLPVNAWFWAAVFAIAWVGQFVGHKIEGAKPSFFEDLQFLLIGPAWVAMNVLGKTPKTA